MSIELFKKRETKVLKTPRQRLVHNYKLVTIIVLLNAAKAGEAAYAANAGEAAYAAEAAKAALSSKSC